MQVPRAGLSERAGGPLACVEDLLELGAVTVDQVADATLDVDDRDRDRGHYAGSMAERRR
jgi:hypothetical protein